MNKRVKVVLFIVLIVIFSHQLCWYLSAGGNFVVWFNNQSEIEFLENVEFYLDDERVIVTDLKSGQLEYQSFIFNISPGKHSIRLVCENAGIDKSYSFYSILVKRAGVEVFTDYENNKDLKTLIYTENVITRKRIN